MKISRIIIGILTIGIVSSCIFLAINKSKIMKENKKLKEQISTIENELAIEKEKSNKQNDKISSCTYTKTYYFIDYLDFEGDIPTDKYIIVDKFQTNEPQIIKYDSSKFNIDFEKNTNYEFTFTSGVLDGKEFKKTVTNINKTDKLGLDQIQEECEVR